MTAQDQRTPPSSTDRVAIATCILAHDQGRDSRDAALLASLYLPDAIVRLGPAPMTARAWIERTCTSPATLASRHRTSNLIVRLEDGGKARSLSYCIAHVQMPDQRQQRFLGGRYLDLHARTDGQWRIAARRFVLDWTIDLPIEESLFAGRLKGESGMGDGDRGNGGAAARYGDLGDLLVDAIGSLDRGAAAPPAPWLHPYPHLTTCFHALRNVRFTAYGDRATGACDLLAIVVAQDDVVITGRLSVTARRTGGIWAIPCWRLTESWRGRRPASAAVLPFDHGRRDGGDPARAFWD